MAPNTPIMIIGAGGYARTIHDAIMSKGKFDVLGFVDNHVEAGQEFCGLPVRLETEFVQSGFSGGIVVGLGDNGLRAKIVNVYRKRLPSATFPIIVHPRAIVSPSAQIGSGTVILGGAVVGANASVGEFCSVWTNAVIEHDSVASDFVTLAPSATTGGNVVIGARTFLGLGCRIIHGVTLGEDCVVGAGAVLTKNCRDRSVMLGVPASEKRQRQPQEPYL